LQAIRLEAFQDECEIGRMQPAKVALRFDHVLAFLQLFRHSSLRSILAPCQRDERAVMLEERGDVVERAMQVLSWPSSRHVAPNLQKRYDAFTTRQR